MTDRVLAPIIVGVTGKRDLNGQDDRVRHDVHRIFERLDHAYPSTPKILLSALADGADTIAAEVALDRPNWRLIAPLPLSPELYCEDFDEKGAARLRSFLSDPRVSTMPLLPLLDAANGGKPLEPEILRRRPGASNTERTAHYEQVGLFIAERSTLLIAVMSGDEKPDRVGGTARIVRYRLSGPFDDTVRSILARSQELRAPNLLDDARSGPVWLIDLGEAKPIGNLPVTVLLPTDRLVGWPLSRGRLIDASLTLADRLHRFNRRALALSEARWQESVVARAGTDTGDATSMLKYLRLAMSAIQIDANKRHKWSVFTLAALFSLAAGVVELREGFATIRDVWWMIYFGCGFFAVVMYWMAGRGFLQQIAEDYRAVAEALRVQIAWWESGLTGPDHRVERSFLCGTSGALALVRSAVRQCVNAALLARKSPLFASGSELRWVDGQIRFFEARIAARHNYLLAVDASNWILFLGALGSASFIALNLNWPDAQLALQSTLKFLWSFVPEGFIFLGTLIILAFASYAAISLQTSGILPRIEHRHPVVRFISILLVVFAGMAFSASLYDLAALLLKNGLLVHATSVMILKLGAEQGISSVEAGQKIAVQFIPLGEAFATIFAVFPAAVAAAVRYVAEKLSWDAELHGYEDALRTFRRAKVELASIEETEASASTKAAQKEALLIALGKEALEESEGWIRAHRERLIEPVV